MSPLTSKTWFLFVSVLLVGCGRFGFGSAETSLVPGVRRDPPFVPTAMDGNSENPSGPTDTSQGNAVGDGDIASDGGTELTDAGSSTDDAGTSKSKPGGGWGGGFHNRDAGTWGGGGWDAGSSNPDAGTTTADAGNAPANGFSCADFPNALSCTAFNSPKSPAFYVDNTTGQGTAVVMNGILDARTQGAPADAYADFDFGPLKGGDVYFRFNVMFPSDGDLTSVNFVTFGDYTDSSDYGVELDAVNGQLSFNSAQSGWTNTTYTLPQDVWMCLDAHVKLDLTSGNMSVRVDGQPALKVNNVNTLPRVGTTLMHAGIDWTRRRERVGHVQVDNVVISLDPVPCP